MPQGSNAQASVLGQVELNAGIGSFMPGIGGAGSAARWTYIWFAGAVAFILFLYFGFGGLRGHVAS